MVSEKPVAQKLLIKPGRKVGLVNAPQDHAELLGELAGGTLVTDESLPLDILVLFANDRADLEQYLPQTRERIAPGGIIWVAYHKGTSKTKTDIHRDSINDYAKTLGMEGIFIISINADWSALRLKLV